MIVRQKMLEYIETFTIHRKLPIYRSFDTYNQIQK